MKECWADQKIIFHKPNNDEKKWIKQIFKTDPAFENCKIHDCFSPDDVQVAELKLNVDKSKLFLTKIDFKNKSNETDNILLSEKEHGKWIIIMDDSIKDYHYLTVTDRQVNGWPILTFPSDPYDRIYDGTQYNCPACTDRKYR